ncbi:MAG: hypothetical protein IPK96_20115 [Flammeovirgaceae bacterium]|nr:hypothetical protein [Flammeovirgaceae bacterium]
MAKKFGGEARYNEITNHVTSVAAEEGLAFDFSKHSRPTHEMLTALSGMPKKKENNWP